MRRLFARLHPFVSRPLNRAVVGVSAGIFSTLFFASNAHAAETVSPGIVNSVIGFMASILVRLTSVVNDVMIAVLDMVITIMQYNRFTSSPVVSAGWSIVRDAVNMFFVVALIAIAVGTIIGYSKFRWQQQVPRLLIFALVINFSKTICGIMIDVGQVVMLTFANALRDVAAGNFIQLFAISTSKLRDTGEVITDFTLFAGTLVGFLASVWVLATVLALAAILLWRIVYLWMLIVISPLTWFIGGMGDLTHSSAYADWWKEFTCMVVIGPILTFFLWLTLVVAGAGNIAVSEFGLAASDANTDVSFQTSIDLLGASQLISFSIAMVMMYAGFRAANNFCEGAKGMAGSLAFGKYMGFPKGGLARKGESRARDLGLVAGGAVVGGVAAGAKGVGNRVGGSDFVQDNAVLARFTEQGKARVDIAKAEKLRKQAAEAGAKGDVHKMQDKLAQASGLEKGAAAAAFKPAEAVKDLDKDAKLGIMNSLIEKARRGEIGASEEQQLEAMYAQALGDDKLMKGLDSSGNLKDIHERFGKQLKTTFKGDKTVMDSLKTFGEKRPDVTGDFSGLTTVEELRKLDPKAWAALSGNKDFEKQIEDIDSGDVWKEDSKELGPDGTPLHKKGTAVKMPDYIKAGRMGGRSREAYEKGLGNFYAKMSGDALTKENIEQLAPHITEDMLKKSPQLAQNLLANAAASEKLKESNLPAFVAANQMLMSDPKALQEFVEKNPLALGNLQGGVADDAAGAAMGKGLESGTQIGTLFTAYKKASDADRAKMAETMDRAQASLDAAGSKFADQFRAERERFDGQVAMRQETLASETERLGGVELGEMIVARQSNVKSTEANIEKMAKQADGLVKSLESARTKLQAEQAKGILADSVKVSSFENAVSNIEDQRSALRAQQEAVDRNLIALRDELQELQNTKSVADAEERAKRTT